ncbi:MAG TPA: hypothetical protein VFB74_25740 [Kribbellaceae bacterium]|nr:hypothetical protein [Kribbellaceae bacterium]
MMRLPAEVRARLEQALVVPHAKRELLALGLARRDLRRLRENGALQCHHRRYIGSHLRPDLARMACAQSAYAGSALSHLTAASLAELRTWVDKKRDEAPPSDAIWLTRPAGLGRNEATDQIVLRLAGLTAADIRPHNRLSITREARTIVDLARELPLREAIVTIDHALAVAVLRTDVDAVLARQAGWPGISSARDAIAFADPRSESALESIARAAFAEHGLPAPVLQASFWRGSGWTSERVDFWWPQFRTFAEADGLAKYEAATPKQRRQQMRAVFVREQRLADLGLEMVRFGWEDAVDDAKGLCGRLRSAFDRGAARPGEAPRWRSDDPYDVMLWPRIPPPDEIWETAS